MINIRFILYLLYLFCFYNIHSNKYIEKFNSKKTEINIDDFFVLAKYLQNDNDLSSIVTINKLINNNKDSIENIASKFLYKKALNSFEKGNLNDSWVYVNKLLYISLITNNQLYLSYCYHIIGNIYFTKNNYTLSIDYYVKSLKIKEEIADFEGIAKLYNNLGSIYFRLKNYDKAIYFFKIALEKSVLSNDKITTSSVYNNIATIYSFQRDFKNASIYFNKSLEINLLLDNKSGIASCLNNIGGVLTEQQKYNSAINYYNYALKINDELNSEYGKCQSMLGLAYLYNKLGLYDKSVNILNECILIAKANSYKEVLIRAYSYLYYSYEQTENYKSAFTTLSNYQMLKDSFYSSATNKIIVETEAKYQNEKKEKELEIKSLRIAQQDLIISNNKNFIIIILIVVILLLIILFISFVYFRIKQKEKIKNELLKQQEEYTKIIIDTQEEERKRIAHELHDNIGYRLTAIKINFEKYDDNLINNTNNNNQLKASISEMIDEAHKEVRSISHQMLPRALREKEFENALIDLLEQSFANTGINYKLDNNYRNEFSETIRICLYRVLQELLNNIIKHAEATYVYIQMLQNKNNFIMIVEDNGIGLSSDYNIKQGIGLMGIRGRINAVAGKFFIENGDVRGTIATIRIPIN